MKLWLDVITFHGHYIISSLFLLAVFLGIAMLFLKNQKEHNTILDQNNYDERKKTAIIPTSKNDQKDKRTENNKEYQNKNYRGTDIETAAWEDASFEKRTGRIGNANAYQGQEKPVEEFPDFEITHTKKEQIRGEVGGVKKSFRDSMVVEINDNYQEHGIVSGLKTTSFEENLIAKRKEEEENSTKNSMAI